MHDFQTLQLLIFDLDGVITSETKYWNTARLTVWELISGEHYLGLASYFGDSLEISNCLAAIGDTIISKQFIYELKSRAINSNWDLTFFVLSLHLVGVFSQFQQMQTHQDKWMQLLNQDNLPVAEKLHQIGQLLQDVNYNYDLEKSKILIQEFWQETRHLTGSDVLEAVTSFTQQKLGVNLLSLETKGDLWQLCYRNFQDWYEGKKGYTLPDDETVLDLTRIKATLNRLSQSGHYPLAIATGRPRNEVIEPMKALGLLKYFDSQRIVTYDEVLEAESQLSQAGKNIKLGKPHPFVLFKAIYPEIPIEILCSEDFQVFEAFKIVYVGDAGSDVVAAKKAGCLSIGVLTGVIDESGKESQRNRLEELGCDLILESILDLPKAIELPGSLVSSNYS